MGFSGYSWGEISSYKIYKGHKSIYRFYNYTGKIIPGLMLVFQGG